MDDSGSHCMYYHYLKSTAIVPNKNRTLQSRPRKLAIGTRESHVPSLHIRHGKARQRIASNATTKNSLTVHPRSSNDTHIPSDASLTNAQSRNAMLFVASFRV